MSRKAAFVYSDELTRHVLHEGHPMRPIRLRYTYELLEALGAFHGQGSRLAEPRSATEKEVLTCHTREYVAAVRSLSRGISLSNAARYGFSEAGDNPIYQGMYEAALLSTGATVVAAEMAAAGEADVAFNISGGLHHAMPSYASGFCVFNDPAIAIRVLLGKGMRRVAYVDIDCHHGDGVERIFYNTDAVLTISLHESGRYLFPGTGFVENMGEGKGQGYKVNVPLAPYTDDDTYLWAFEQVVPPLLEAFKPEALVTQLGMDTYYTDPITHMGLTSRGFTQSVEALGKLSKGRPWVALGGGGYDISAVARCWALAYGIMAERDMPDQVPEPQRQRLGKASLRDTAGPEIPDHLRKAAKRHAEATVAQVRERIFPYHGLRAAR